MGRRFGTTVLLASITAALVLGGGTAATATEGQERGFVNRINRERVDRGLRQLATKSDLATVARRHSARMADAGDIWHNQNLPNEVSGRWTVLGENVGMGGSVDSLHQAFMDSDGHRRNVLFSNYDQVGVGVVESDQMIFVTVVFAGGRTAATPAPRKTSSPAPRRTQVPTSAPPRSEAPSSAPAEKSSAPRAAAGESAERKDTNGDETRTVDLMVRLLGLGATS